MKIRYVVVSILFATWNNIPYLITETFIEPIGALAGVLGGTLAELGYFWIIGRISEKKAMQLFYVISGYLILNTIYLISVFVFYTHILYSVTIAANYIFWALKLYVIGSSIYLWGAKRGKKPDPPTIDGTIM